jgi:hypothetical protein
MAKPHIRPATTMTSEATDSIERLVVMVLSSSLEMERGCGKRTPGEEACRALRWLATTKRTTQ